MLLRSAISGILNRGMILVPVMALLSLWTVPAANASILFPQDSAADFDQLLAQLEAKELARDEQSTTADKHVGTQENSDQEKPDTVEQHLFGLLARPHSPVDGPMSGTSTSTYSGPNTSSGTMLYSHATTVHPDLALLGWVQGDARFTLPMPPGNDLLRPPQA